MFTGEGNALKSLGRNRRKKTAPHQKGGDESAMHSFPLPARLVLLAEAIVLIRLAERNPPIGILGNFFRTIDDICHTSQQE